MPFKKHSIPTITTKTVAQKIAAGFAAEGWKIVGQGGSQLGGLRPLLRYLAKQGVRVHTSSGHNLKNSKSVVRL